MTAKNHFMLPRFLLLLTLLLGGAAQAATPAPFDLAGPTLDVVITRGKMILPASEVPNLAEGDRIWIRPEFPATQSAHYLMVAAFLSGSTNPPPESWFFPCKTWTGRCAREGLSVTVPKGAQQALIFLAPETSGDVKGIVDAVRGRPGAFVRATQDLNQATLDRSRLERYLEVVHALEPGDPAVLRQVAPLLARSLAIKVDDKCLDKIPQLQAACLTQGQEALILNDGHSMSIAATLTTGVAADLVMAVSATPELGYGVYSPYIASVLDLVRIFDSFRTATYQYIPALTSHKNGKLALTLNTPPSFHAPMSVMVVALPAIDKPHLPPLRAVNPADIYCASRDDLVLPVEGAPLAFSTRYAHDITLTLQGKDGKTVRLPAWADAAQGGYVVNTANLKNVDLGDSVRGSLQGYWGFVPYEGPGFTLRNARANAWALAQGDEDALVVGRPDTVHLRSDNASCVDNIMLRDPSGKELKAEWKPLQAGVVEVKLPLQDARPGEMTLLIRQSGLNDPHPLPIQVFASAARLDAFQIYAGDTQGTLKGQRLDQVASLTLNRLTFLPGELQTGAGGDQLSLVAQDAQAAGELKPDASAPARVTLKDGRVLSMNASIDPPRPRVSLIGKNVSASASAGHSGIQAGSGDQLPQDARLTFSIRAQTPASFGRELFVEVATEDESFLSTLSLANGGIKLENNKVALLNLEPAQAFGFSAFGPLKFRPRIGGIAGDWQPLAHLVRLPQLKTLLCPADTTRACKLSGSDLFLIDSLSGQADFSQAVTVSDGFPGSSLPVPHPSEGRLYLRLRDDPSVINAVTLEAQTLPAPDAAADPAAGKP
ncbi:hypothetical protein SAMN04488038_11532 [Solimonas aquatica]|uniref:Uncharacterized protein n=2 Tax=Solimonas aquatica TaxID=489703 RepID=A0A1H9L652_9GAMM|nr:hypothetical protein SAMN04488038_11532 [Solimonas aquatica]